ncbi:MAG: hypothetical protein ACOYB1_00475 [Limnohabitans sp.]
MASPIDWPLVTEQVARLERLLTRHDVSINGKTMTWRRLGDPRR